jgi:hypothetical protein
VVAATGQVKSAQPKHFSRAPALARIPSFGRGSVPVGPAQELVAKPAFVRVQARGSCRSGSARSDPAELRNSGFRFVRPRPVGEADERRPQSLDLGSRGGHPGRLADAEAIVAAIGPGLPDFQLVTALLRELRAQDAALDLLVFGFVTVRESRSGKVSFVFENARDRRTWTAAGLEDFAALLESMAANAERLQEAAEGLE